MGTTQATSGTAAAPGRPPMVRRAGWAGSDVEVAARLHTEQIDGGFLSLLGPEFLALLYRRVVRHPASFLLVATDGDRVGGFLAGSTDVPGLYRAFARADGLRAARLAARHALPRWRHVLETARHGTGPAGGEGGTGGAELLATAVDPAWRGRGVGRALVDAFLAEVTARGGTEAHVVVGAANAPAVALYRGAGFGGDEIFELHRGTPSLLLRWHRP